MEIGDRDHHAEQQDRRPGGTGAPQQFFRLAVHYKNLQVRKPKSGDGHNRRRRFLAGVSSVCRRRFPRCSCRWRLLNVMSHSDIFKGAGFFEGEFQTLDFPVQAKHRFCVSRVLFQVSAISCLQDFLPKNSLVGIEDA